MARKVGFDRPDTEPKKSIADSYLDEFRQRNKAEQARKSKPKPVAPKKRRNWILIVFLSIWLLLWTIGIVTVLGIIGSGGAEPFLIIWVCAALFGWFVAVGVLIVQIRGKPIKTKDEL